MKLKSLIAGLARVARRRKRRTSRADAKPRLKLRLGRRRADSAAPDSAYYPAVVTPEKALTAKSTPTPSPRTKAVFNPVSIHVAGANGAPIPTRVIDVGSGPTVVFLHGLVGLNDHWEDVVRCVCDRLRCVMVEFPLLDLRDEDCSIHGVTALTARYLEENLLRGGEPPIIVGNSFGGHVALKLAIDRPELVRGLVLAGASGLIEKSMVAEIQIRPSREWLREKIAELFHDRSKMRESDLDRAHQALSVRGGARAMIKLSRSARRNHLGRQISQIQHPTLLIWGREDIVTPPEAAEGFLKAIRNSRIDWYDKCGHAPMIECPDLFAQSLLRFCEELEAGARG